MVVAGLLLAGAMACQPTAITETEAKHLAIHAARIHDAYPRERPYLDAEVSDRTPRSVDFRVFSRRYEPGIHSNLAGWFRVDLFSARLSDPILDGQPIDLPPVATEQRELAAHHCLAATARSTGHTDGKP